MRTTLSSLLVLGVLAGSARADERAERAPRPPAGREAGFPEPPPPPVAPPCPDGPPRAIGPEQEEALRDFCREHLPEAWERLERLARDNPFEHQRALRAAVQHMGQLRQLREQDPEAFQEALQETRLNLKAEDLARQIRERRVRGKDGEETGKLTTELGKLLEQQFALREARRQRELRQLEARVERLKELLERRSRSRAEIIERHLRRMTGEGEGDEW